MRLTASAEVVISGTKDGDIVEGTFVSRFETGKQAPDVAEETARQELRAGKAVLSVEIEARDSLGFEITSVRTKSGEPYLLSGRPSATQKQVAGPREMASSPPLAVRVLISKNHNPRPMLEIRAGVEGVEVEGGIKYPTTGDTEWRDVHGRADEDGIVDQWTFGSKKKLGDLVPWEFTVKRVKHQGATYQVRNAAKTWRSQGNNPNGPFSLLEKI